MKGVATGDMGDRPGRRADRATTSRAWSCTPRYTLFAEGCRGSLTKTLIERFNLRDGVDPQTYGIGIKELWEVEPAKHKPGLVVHTDRLAAGPQDLWRLVPLPPGGQPGRGRLRRRPRLPEPALARSTSSSASRRTRRSGRSSRAAGASPTARARWPRAASSRSRKLVFPGGALIGDTAGFLNVPKIKGTHTAMKSGMVCAEAVFEALAAEQAPPIVEAYPEALKETLAVGGAATGCATSGRRSTPGLWAASPIRRSTPTCSAARRRGPSSTTPTTSTLKPADASAEDRVPEAGRRSSPSTGCPRCSSPTPTTRKTSRPT